MRALAALEVRLERALLRRTVDGDTAALVDLFDRLAPAAYGMACRVTGDESRAQECVEIVFIDLWRMAPDLAAGGESARTWALTRTHRLAVERRRADARSRRPDPQRGQAPEARAARETEGRGDEALAPRVPWEVVDGGCREMIEWMYLDGLTYREVAHRRGLDPRTVKGVAREALRRLQRSMAASPPGPPGDASVDSIVSELNSQYRAAVDVEHTAGALAENVGVEIETARTMLGHLGADHPEDGEDTREQTADAAEEPQGVEHPDPRADHGQRGA